MDDSHVKRFPRLSTAGMVAHAFVAVLVPILACMAGLGLMGAYPISSLVWLAGAIAIQIAQTRLYIDLARINFELANRQDELMKETADGKSNTHR